MQTDLIESAKTNMLLIKEHPTGSPYGLNPAFYRAVRRKQKFDKRMAAQQKKQRLLAFEEKTIAKQRQLRRANRKAAVRRLYNFRANLTAPLLRKVAADFYGVSVADFKKRRGGDAAASARHLCSYLMYRLLGMTAHEIGCFLGRDYAAAIYGINVAPEKLRAFGYRLKSINYRAPVRAKR